jgi:type I restriction enzyme S subunit
VSGINKLINNKRRQIALLEQKKLVTINEAVSNNKWALTRIGHLYTSILGKMLAPQPKSSNDTYEKYLCAKDVHFDEIDILSAKEMWFSPNEKKQYRVKNGDLLIVEGGAGAGGSCVYDFDTDDCFYVQNSIQIIRSKGESSNKFLYYYMYSLVKQGYIEYICEKATIPHYTKERLLNTPIPVVYRNEQDRIVAYLEDECSNIDRIITKLNEEITLFNEYRIRLISDVVTGKLDVLGVEVPEYEAVEETADENAMDEEITDNTEELA